VTSKEAFDANPPERTNRSVILYSSLGGGLFFVLCITILICRKCVISHMLREEVQKDEEWLYDPYESAKPKIQTVAKVRMAIAMMQAERSYQKYYSVEDSTNRPAAGKIAMALSAFLKAKPPEDSRPTMAHKVTDVAKLAAGVNAFKTAHTAAAAGGPELEGETASEPGEGLEGTDLGGAPPARSPDLSAGP